MTLLRYDDAVDIILASTKPVYLWGCSTASKKTLEIWKPLPIRVAGVIDNRAQDYTDFLGHPVFDPSVLEIEEASILLVQGNHAQAIHRQLRSMDRTDLEVIFDHDNGGDRLLNTKDLYIELDYSALASSLKEHLIRENALKIASYDQIERRPSGAKVLLGLDHLLGMSEDSLLAHKLEESMLAYANQVILSESIYVGCGDDYREGYLHSDLRALRHVDIVCNAWDLSSHVIDLKKIYTRHMLEHLTDREAVLTLKDWYNTLQSGGELEIIVPNFDLRCKQWFECEWEPFAKRTEAEVWSVAGLWGWQRECDPKAEDYNQTYWDVHKSGYNAKRITMILTELGYSNISTSINARNDLIAFAYKK